MDMHGDKKIEFKATFGVPLTKFMHPIFGFNIVAFDKFVKTPNGTSLKQYLTDAYSSYASELVNKLIS